jgi:hypothetical protein
MTIFSEEISVFFETRLKVPKFLFFFDDFSSLKCAQKVRFLKVLNFTKMAIFALFRIRILGREKFREIPSEKSISKISCEILQK